MELNVRFFGNWIDKRMKGLDLCESLGNEGIERCFLSRRSDIQEIGKIVLRKRYSS